MTYGYLEKLLGILSEGMLISIEIFAITLLISIPLGFLVAAGRRSKNKLVSFLLNIYILIMRGTPLMLQIIFIYFAPFYIFDLSLKDFRFPAVIIAFSINYAAYFAEIFRGGIDSMPVGQYEAAFSLGYTKKQTFFSIILPQVIKRIIPATANEVITLIKDTALAQAVGVVELYTLARKQASFMTNVWPLFIAGVFYFVFNWFITILFQWIEKKLNYYR